MSNYLLLIILIISCALYLLALVIVVLFLRKILKKINYTENSLRSEIKASVQSKFIDIAPAAKNLIEFAVEVWRIEVKMKKIKNKLSENQKQSLNNSVQKIKRNIDQYDLEIRDYTGTKYNSGITGIEVVSVEKDKTSHEDMVKETLEPAVLLKGQIVKKAKVIISSDN